MHCGDQRHLGLCLGFVPALAYGSCRVSDQGTTLRASDLHNARATILNPFNNHEIHDIGARSHDSLHLFPTRTSGARLVLRHYIPELLQKFPDDVLRKVRTHSIDNFVSHIKTYLIDLYSFVCSVPNCFVCKRWCALCAPCYYVTLSNVPGYLCINVHYSY